MTLVWGTLHLFLARSRALWRIRWQSAVHEKIPLHGDSDDWSFAQVFEVVILFLPVLQVGEAYIGKSIYKAIIERVGSVMILTIFGLANTQPDALIVIFKAEITVGGQNILILFPTKSVIITFVSTLSHTSMSLMSARIISDICTNVMQRYLEHRYSTKMETLERYTNSIANMGYESQYQRTIELNVKNERATPHNQTGQDGIQTQMHCSSSKPCVRIEHNTTKPVTIASTETTPASQSATSNPFFVEPPHLRNSYKKQSFRLLIALIILLSLSNIAYIIAISLLYDIDWSFLALIFILAFSLGQVVLWAIGGVVWGHCADKVEGWLMKLDGVNGRGIKRGFSILGWVLWLAMVGVNIFVQVWLDST